MFSPWYAAARRRGPTAAAAHPALNVALYRPGGDRWVMTERGASDLHRAPDTLAIGASDVTWEGDTLVARFDERCATFPSPRPARLSGVVRVTPRVRDGRAVTLDGGAGHHRWWPIAPSARAEVVLDAPDLRFSGEAYVDANAGDAPIDAGFRSWSWSRMSCATGTAVAYHTQPHAGAPLSLTRHYAANGAVTAIDGQLAQVPRTRWGLGRTTVVDRGTTPTVARTLEDTPFYARSLVAAELGGARGIAVHESLDAARFAAGWVRFLLPFRSRREARRA